MSTERGPATNDIIEMNFVFKSLNDNSALVGLPIQTSNVVFGSSPNLPVAVRGGACAAALAADSFNNFHAGPTLAATSICNACE